MNKLVHELLALYSPQTCRTGDTSAVDSVALCKQKILVLLTREITTSLICLASKTKTNYTGCITVKSLLIADMKRKLQVLLPEVHLEQGADAVNVPDVRVLQEVGRLIPVKCQPGNKWEIKLL